MFSVPVLSSTLWATTNECLFGILLLKWLIVGLRYRGLLWLTGRSWTRLIWSDPDADGQLAEKEEKEGGGPIEQKLDTHHANALITILYQYNKWVGQWGQRSAGQYTGMKSTISVDGYREMRRRIETSTKTTQENVSMTSSLTYIYLNVFFKKLYICFVCLNVLLWYAWDAHQREGLGGVILFSFFFFIWAPAGFRNPQETARSPMRWLVMTHIRQAVTKLWMSSFILSYQKCWGAHPWSSSWDKWAYCSVSEQRGL